MHKNVQLKQDANATKNGTRNIILFFCAFEIDILSKYK